MKLAVDLGIAFRRGRSIAQNPMSETPLRILTEQTKVTVKPSKTNKSKSAMQNYSFIGSEVKSTV